MAANFEVFSGNPADWAQWSRRFDQWLLLNPSIAAAADDAELRNTIKRAALCTYIGPATFTLLCSLCSPEVPEQMQYDELKLHLNNQFKVDTFPRAERHKFYQCTQKEGQTLADYAAELKKLALTCKWSRDQLKDNLGDKFVTGLRNSQLIQKLLQCDIEDSVDDLLKVAQLHETAVLEARVARPESHTGLVAVKSESLAAVKSNQRHKIKRHSKSANVSNPNSGTGNHSSQASGTMGTKTKTTKFRCSSCGLDNHARKDCKYRNVVCNACNKIGHLAKVCRSKGKATGAVQTNNAEHSAVIGITSTEIVPPYYATLELPELSRKMKLMVDSGSSASFLTKATWNDLDCPKLQPVSKDLKLHAFGGQAIRPIGQFTSKVKCGSQMSDVTFLITNAGLNILGRAAQIALKITITPNQYVASVPTDNNDVPCQLDEIVDRHPELWDGFGCCKIRARLTMQDGVVPKFLKPRKVPFALKSAVGNELDRLVHIGVLERVSSSDWATPTVNVIKPNGKVRICGDYKVTINPVLKVDIYPIPKPEELFHQLQGGCSFTKLDLADAYLQIPLDEQSQELTVINTHQGLYKYKRLCFGLSSSPAIFQQVMEKVLGDLPGVAVYLDDVIVTGSTPEVHLANLERVMERLASSGLKLRKDKCAFFRDSVTYLGHTIDKHGIKADQNKIKAITEMPNPTSKAELRSFLGMVRYYDRFIKNLATKCAPLNDLLCESVVWDWSASHSLAVKEIKAALVSTQNLTHYDPSQPLTLACDASSTGIGATIFHTFADGSEIPIAHASRKLTKAERNYAQIQREALAIIFGVQKYRQYLLGRQFTLLTDHKPLTTIFNPTKGIPETTNSRLQRWALILSAYNFEICYKPTDAHGNADALSRLPVPGRIHNTDCDDLDSFPVLFKVNTDTIVCSVEHQQINELPIQASDIAKVTQNDTILGQVYTYSIEGWPMANQIDSKLKPFYQKRFELSIDEGCILWGLRVVIPKRYQNKIIDMLHTGHPGMSRMKSLSKLHVWWPSINADIENHVRSCSACAENSREPDRAPVHPWIRPITPWSRIHVDFAGPFLGSMYLLVIDSYSKWIEVNPMVSTTTNDTIRVLRSIFATHGLPEIIVSDNGPQFIADTFKAFCQERGIKHLTSAPYHPQSNGEVERLVQSFKASMSKSTSAGVKKGEALQNFLASYRFTPHCTTGVVPATALLGRKVKTILDLVHPAGKSITKSYPKPHTRVLQPSDTVWVRMWAGRRWVPGIIQQRKSNVMYCVKLLDGKFTVRHINQLKSRLQGNEPTTSVSPNPETIDNDTTVDDNHTDQMTPPRAVLLPLETPFGSPPVAAQAGEEENSIVVDSSDSNTTNEQSSNRSQRTRKAPLRLIEEM